MHVARIKLAQGRVTRNPNRCGTNSRVHTPEKNIQDVLFVVLFVEPNIWKMVKHEGRNGNKTYSIAQIKRLSNGRQTVKQVAKSGS